MNDYYETRPVRADIMPKSLEETNTAKYTTLRSESEALFIKNSLIRESRANKLSERLATIGLELYRDNGIYRIVNSSDDFEVFCRNLNMVSALADSLGT